MINLSRSFRTNRYRPQIHTHSLSLSTTHTKRWWRKVVEKKQYFHCLRQKKQDLEVHIRCLLPQYLLVFVWYGFIDWHIYQVLDSMGVGLGLVCSWLSYGSVCTGSSLNLLVLALFTTTLSRKDSHTGYFSLSLSLLHT